MAQPESLEEIAIEVAQLARGRGIECWSRVDNFNPELNHVTLVATGEDAAQIREIVHDLVKLVEARKKAERDRDLLTVAAAGRKS